MNSHDWALILFTILTQMSVGSFVILGIVHFFAAKKADEKAADVLSDRALLAIIPVLVLGVIASLFHLGNPLTAYRALANIGTSWLSREVTTVIIFGVFALTFVILQWFKVGSTVLRQIFAWIAAIIGIVLVYIMARIYMLPAQPAWNTAATPVTFYTTMLLLGSLAIGAAYVASYTSLKKKAGEDVDMKAQAEILCASMCKISMAAIVLLGVELVTIPIYISSLATGGDVAVQSAGLFISDYGVLFVLRLVLGFVGAGVFGVLLYRNAMRGDESKLSTLAYGAFVLVLAAEVIGRVLFYATHLRIGI